MNIKQFAQTAINNFDSHKEAVLRSESLKQMKKLILQFNTLPPFNDKIDPEEYYLSTAMLEREMDFHLSNNDTKNFENAFMKIKQFYFDFNNQFPKSDKRLYFIGLFLLHLLVNNRSTEFSTELEALDVQDMNDHFIYIPRYLNECFMEGKYKKVSVIKTQVDDHHYKFYLNMFNNAVRYEIVRSIEKSHDSIKISKFKDLLGFESDQELREYIKKECENFDSNKEIEWKIVDDSINFTPVIFSLFFTLFVFIFK